MNPIVRSPHFDAAPPRRQAHLILHPHRLPGPANAVRQLYLAKVVDPAVTGCGSLE